MQFYAVQIKEKVEVAPDQVTVVVMENGRSAAKAEVEHNGQTLKLFKFLSEDSKKELLEQGATDGGKMEPKSSE